MLEYCRTTQSSQRDILGRIIGRGVQVHALGGTESGPARLCKAVKAGRRRRWVTEGRRRRGHDKQNRTVHNGQGQTGIKDKSAPRSGGGVEMKSGCGLWTAPDQLQFGVASS
jgi:hypothetical protein